MPIRFGHHRKHFLKCREKLLVPLQIHGTIGNNACHVVARLLADLAIREPDYFAIMHGLYELCLALVAKFLSSRLTLTDPDEVLNVRHVFERYVDVWRISLLPRSERDQKMAI